MHYMVSRITNKAVTLADAATTSIAVPSTSSDGAAVPVLSGNYVARRLVLTVESPGVATLPVTVWAWTGTRWVQAAQLNGGSDVDAGVGYEEEFEWSGAARIAVSGAITGAGAVTVTATPLEIR